MSLSDEGKRTFALQGTTCKTDIHVLSLLDKRNCFCDITYCLATKLNKCFTLWCRNLVGYLFTNREVSF